MFMTSNNLDIQLAFLKPSQDLVNLLGLQLLRDFLSLSSLGHRICFVIRVLSYPGQVGR